MAMNPRFVMLLLPVVLVSGAASGQEVSESVMRTCRATSAQTARIIAYAVRANIDPATQVKRVADSWLEGVQNHMLLAASRAPHLSEGEHAAIGYSYCVERRPANVR